MFPVKYTLNPSVVASVEETGLGGIAAVGTETEIPGGFIRISLTYRGENIRQDDTFVRIRPAFVPDFRWSPHVTPEEGNIAAQHIFRTPALIARGESKTLILIPDVRLAEKSPVPWYLDMNAAENTLTIGMSRSAITNHVIYTKAPGAVYQGEVTLAFYVLAVEKALTNPFRPVLDFLWTRDGHGDSERCLGHMKDLTPYVRHTYHWAFDSWKNVMWQEFEWNGSMVGAPTFIVNVTQSPNYPGPVNERELRSIWNQAWFCSLRSASGLYRHARRHENSGLMEYARKTKELALSFPQTDGLFDSVIATEMKTVEEDGVSCNRSCGWETKYLGNSNRNPFTWSVKDSPKHILDMSFLCYYMLVWYDELERDERLLRYVSAFADRLIRMQDSDGFYPGWVRDDGTPAGILDQSPESSMGAACLMKLYSLTGEEKYARSARQALDAVMTHIVPVGRWEDFETYWSCCRFWSDHVGEKMARNDMYKQCNFSMYFTALAMMEAYKATGERRYLTDGTRVLDELLMTQSSYQPANLPIPVVGGFGVMNCDGELNDSRESLFAPLILEYGRSLDCAEYRERGLAALRAGFSMMYCPENPEAKAQWEATWPFFNERDYGFTMENYGHGGETGDGGIGIGEFTIYDWGNGAASEAWETVLDRNLLQ